MVRTKNIAKILRALEIQATTSSSSSSDNDVSDSEDQRASTGSTDLSMPGFEGVPNAQDTDEVQEKTQEADGDDGGSSEREIVGQDRRSQASRASHVDQSEGEKCSDVASSGSRKREYAECDDELYYVPPLQKYHKSWKDLEKCLEKYRKDTHTMLVIAETQNVRLRNKKIVKMKIHMGKPESELPLVPEALDPYQRVYICTHGWKERVRSKGHRPRHTVKGVGCPMRFRAQYVQRSGGKWRIEVKQPFYGHNHALSEETYRNYPSVRQLPKDSPVMSDVELMVASGSKASRIYDYIRERTPHYVQLKDVHNLIARIKKSGGRLSDEDLVAELLVGFELESPGNVAAVDEDTGGHTAVVTISSQHMRKLYKRFPEILLVDCTHKTNRYNYQLCTLMVMDQFGHGQAVQHSVLERNADWHMEKAVEQFHLANDWKRTKVIMVDKDLTEIGVLRAKFPAARILLCQFHVLKWLRGAIRDDKKYDTYPTDILKQMDHCVANMVYAKSDEELDQHAAEFKHLACRDGRNSLWTYFDKNWIECKEMWVTLHRMNLPHFRNNTNNRLESFFGKLKADLDSSMSMRECLVATIRYQRRKEDEYATLVVMPGTRRDLTLDDEMNQLLGMTSEWVAEVFEPEYKFAVDPSSTTIYIIEDDDLYVNFTRNGHKYRVDKYNWMCTCEFSSTMKLPCRHGMIYRKHVARMLTIPYSSIPVRWLRVGSLDEEIAAVDIPLRISSAGGDKSRKKRMTERDKFKKAQSVFSLLSTELSDLPDHKCMAALDNLEKWRGRLRLGDVTMDTPGSTEELDEDMAPTEIAASGTTADMEEKDENVHAGRTEEKDANTTEVKYEHTTEEKDELVCVDTTVVGTSATEGENEKAEGKKVKMKPFTPRVRVGRPRKDRAAEAAQRRQSRKEYNHGSKLRGALRGDDVVEVAEFIKSCEPPLSDLSSFLTTFEVRHLQTNPKQLSVVWRVPQSSVIPYRLPEAIVREGLRLIELKRPFGEPIDLCTPVDTNAECWVISVASVGDFTHQQLLAMQYVWSLVDASEKGMNCYSWLMSIADDQICYEETAAVAKRMLDAWPKERLPGFGEGVDIEWTHLYCARNGCWYNDNLITAYGKMVEGVYGNNTTILLPPMKTPVPKTPKKGMRVPTTTLSFITAASSGRIFLSLNINGTHWTCIVVDGSTQTVCCYDSTDKRANHNLLAELADEIVKKSLTKAFSVTVVHSPIQKDGFNCGVFICLYFWRRFWKGAGSDYTAKGLLRRRWDILRTIMEFSDESKAKEKPAE